MLKKWKYIDRYKISIRLDYINLERVPYSVIPFMNWVNQGNLVFNIQKVNNKYYCKMIDIRSDEKGFGGIIFYQYIEEDSYLFR